MIAQLQRRKERIRASALVAMLHALIGYALLTGLGVELAPPIDDRLSVFAVPLPAPPPERTVPAPVRVKAPEGGAAPPSVRARPTPVVAPRRDRPSPIAAAPRPAPVPTGTAPTAGASETPGPGTGAGGEGSGAGAGRGGSGTGGGGTPMRAVRIAGTLGDSDYPGRPRPRIVESVGVRFLVGTDGRVTSCSVTRSSGNARLDGVTCRLIEQRFRYRPARNASGEPAPSVVNTIFDWIPPELRRR